jgi:hypothetical protein
MSASHQMPARAFSSFSFSRWRWNNASKTCTEHFSFDARLISCGWRRAGLFLTHPAPAAPRARPCPVRAQLKFISDISLLKRVASNDLCSPAHPAAPARGLHQAPAAVTTSSPSSSGAARLASTCALERAPTAMCRYDRFPCAAFREHKRLTGRPCLFPTRGRVRGRAMIGDRTRNLLPIDATAPVHLPAALDL